MIPDCIAVLQLDNWTLVPFLPVAIDPGLEYVGGGRVGQPIIGPIRKAFLPLDPGILRASPPGGPKRGRPRVKPEGRLLTAAARDGRTIVRAGTEEWLRRGPNQRMARHRRATCRQITSPNPKRSTLHETGVGPADVLGRIADDPIQGTDALLPWLWTQ